MDPFSRQFGGFPAGKPPPLARGFPAGVLYPLISLLNDMFNRLKNRVHVINMREEIISKETMIEVLNRVKESDSFFLIGTHESFLKQFILHSVIKHLHKGHLCFVFDEAHTIPTWGLDFRRRLIDVCLKISEAPDFQLILSSATISNEDISFICNIQKLREIHIISKLQIRKELQYKIYDVSIIHPKLLSLKSVEKEIPAFIGFLKNLLSEKNCGIIFLDNIKRLMALYRRFQHYKFGVAIYNGKMRDVDKKRNLELWISGNRQLLLATSAVSLGVNNPNCNFTIHLGCSSSLLNFLQESGRCGRRGQTSLCMTILDKSYTYKKVTSLIERVEKNEMKREKEVTANTVIQGNNRLLSYLGVS